MTAPLAPNHLAIDSLLHRLRYHGVAVGVREHARLVAIFGLDMASSDWNERRLHNVLAAIVVKSEQDRDAFDYAFYEWIIEADRKVRSRAPRRSDSVGPDDDASDREPRAPHGEVERDDAAVQRTHDRTSTIETARQQRKVRIAAITAFLLFAMLAVIWGALRMRDRGQPLVLDPPAHLPSHSPDVEPDTDRVADSTDRPPLRLLSTYRTYEFRLTPLEVESFLIPRAIAAALGVTALGVCILLWRRRKRVIGTPRTFDASQARYRPWRRLPPGQGRYLSPSAVREVVWGVDRYLSDDAADRYDIVRTVDETARAGQYHLFRERLAYPREVWLFVDCQLESSALRAQLREIESFLTAAGVAVRSGTFLGTPREITFDHSGISFSPVGVDGAARQSIVLLATDGRGIREALRSNALTIDIDATLRALAPWPRLAFVDPSEGAYDLTDALRPHDIPCIHPGQIAAFLTGRSLPPLRSIPLDIPLTGERAFWAGGLALWPEPFDTATALELRARMQLRLASDELDRVVHHARRVGERLEWSERRRRELLNHVSRFATQNGDMAASSPLGRAIAFWRERAAHEAADREANDPEWRDSRAARMLERNVALMDLWQVDRAASATDRLVALDLGDLSREVRRGVTELTVRPGRWPADPDFVALPWHPSDGAVDSGVVAKLYGLGFATAHLEPVEVGRPAPSRGSAFGIGAAIGLAAALAVFALRPPRDGADPSERPRLIAGASLDAHAIAAVWDPKGGEHRVRLIGDGIEPTTIKLDAGRWQVDLEELELPARGSIVVVPPTGTGTGGRIPEPLVRETWRRATLGWPVPRVRLSTAASAGEPIPEENRPPTRRLVVVDRDDDDGKRIAARMLDGGNAEVAIVGPDWRRWLDRISFDECVLIVSALPGETFDPGVPWHAYDSANVAEMLNALDFIGPADDRDGNPFRPLDALEHWKSLGSSGGDAPAVRGGPEMVAIPGGTFWMGSPEEDLKFPESDPRKAWDDEIPRHQVTVGRFELSRYEITRGQFRRVMSTGLNDAGRRSADSTIANWQDADDRMPATSVDWFDAVRFCNRLSAIEGLTPHYDIRDGDDLTVDWERKDATGYRLPTEAEWEYACRAGSEDRWVCGDEPDRLAEYAWFDRSYSDGPFVVGVKLPNAWGLHDMAGNAYEWCWDWYGAYSPDEQLNPPGPATGDFRLLRGGSWLLSPRLLRSAYRLRDSPTLVNVFVGFRVVRGPLRQP